jgi:hypothetical protein
VVKQKQSLSFESFLSHIELFARGTAAVSRPVASPHLVDIPDAELFIHITLKPVNGKKCIGELPVVIELPA